MPRGKRLATITKNSRAVATSLRLRAASSRSRPTSVRAMASMSVLQIDQMRRRVERARLMRAVNQAAARFHIAREQLLYIARSRRVERGARLIQEPERHRLRDQQPSERDAPALPLREAPHRQVRHGKSDWRPAAG